MDNGGMWQSCWWGTDNSDNNHHDSPASLVDQDSDSNTRPRQAGQRRDESGDVTVSVDMVSGHCCCCPLGLAQRPCSIFQRPCQQGRHCTCSIIHAHNVHVQPHGQPLHPLEVQQQRLPTPWRGTQVDKSIASKNNTHSVQTDPSQRLLCCIVNHRLLCCVVNHRLLCCVVNQRLLCCVVNHRLLCCVVNHRLLCCVVNHRLLCCVVNHRLLCCVVNHRLLCCVVNQRLLCCVVNHRLRCCVVNHRFTMEEILCDSTQLHV